MQAHLRLASTFKTSVERVYATLIGKKTSHMANPDNEVGKCLPTESHGKLGVGGIIHLEVKEWIIENNNNNIYHRSQIYYTL